MSVSNETIKSLEVNPFFQRYKESGIKEALFSDTIGAIGHMQNKIVSLCKTQLDWTGNNHG